MIRFAVFEIDPVAGELFRSGRRVHLTPQAIRLLVLLASRPGEVVTREEIRKALWPGDTFVDFDASMNACISQIRSALGDRAGSPRFVETLPRRGYRFVAPIEAPTRVTPTTSVNEVSAEVASAHAHPRARSGVRRISHSAAALMVLAVAAGALAAIALYSGKRTDPLQYARTRNVEAIQKLERGRSGLADAAPDELVDRVRHLERAITLEPEFTEAYVALAEAKLLIAQYRREPAVMAYAAAKAAGAKALSLDSRSGDAHAVYAASALLFEWDWPAAREHLAEAQRLSPRSSRVHHWYSRYLTAIGQHDRALQHATLAARQSATSPSGITNLGVTAYYAARFDDARAHCRHALELMPEFQPARVCLSAVDDIRREHPPAYPDAYLEPVLKLTREGDRQSALASLQRAANRRSDVLVFASIQPALGELAAEPAYVRILERVGMKPRSVSAQRNHVR